MRFNTWKSTLKLAAAGVMTALLLSGCSNMMVLDPKGPIAAEQKNLILITIVLCLIIMIPVFALTAFIIFRYRDKPNNKAAYKPNWAHNPLLETIWWGIPIAWIVGALLSVSYYRSGRWKHKVVARAGER